MPNETYSQFKSRLPDDVRISRRARTVEFRRKVGIEARRYRDKYFPATNRSEDRQARWLIWLEDVHFDEAWEQIAKIDDDVVNDMAQGKRRIEFAIAIYYRLHGVTDDLSFANAIDTFVFDKPLQDLGRVVFEETPDRDPPKTEDGSAQRDIGTSLPPNPKPRLDIWTADATIETRFLFRSRAIPYLDEGDGFAQLDHFNALDGAFRWHVTYGAGGTGKSRLALEYAIQNRERFHGQIGFLSAEQARSFGWEAWQPNHPTFIIVDYAARETDAVAGMVRVLSLREDIVHPIRLLLLERDMTGSWFDKISHDGKAEAPAVEATWSGFDGLLEAPDDVWPIIQYIAEGSEQTLPSRNEALDELERIDHRMRPLFAAFLGDAYARGEDPRQWDARALVDNVLRHEQRYWKAGDVDQTHVNLCACATATGGIHGTWLEPMSRNQMNGYWPAWQGNKTLETLSAIYGAAIIDDIPPLEPDILGEAFVLDYWQNGSRYEREYLLAYGGTMGPWFAEFIERVVSDFPGEASFRLLESVIGADFNEHISAKPELLYNIVTSLVKTYPQLAHPAYRQFGAIGAPVDQSYYSECLLDSALNIIVGIDELAVDDALGIYKQLTALLPSRPLPLENERSRCAVALSLIAKFPGEDHRLMRPVLADALRCHRAWPDDDEIRRDACVALANYSNLLPPEEIAQATRLLRLFQRLAQDDHEGDMEDAWAYILYHQFLLLLTKNVDENEGFLERERKALFSLQELAPATGLYSKSLRNLWMSDLEE